MPFGEPALSASAWTPGQFSRLDPRRRTFASDIVRRILNREIVTKAFLRDVEFAPLVDAALDVAEAYIIANALFET
ncbi:hypothetical protein [Palleronia aestuarii]|nr:hypothetical protein [Palleronia aestuarii]